MNDAKDGVIPIGLCKQAHMKLESALVDIMEIKEDDDLSEEDKETFSTMAETLGLMMAHIVNIVTKEIGEDDFLNEDVGMDELDPYPETPNIMDMEIE